MHRLYTYITLFFVILCFALFFMRGLNIPQCSHTLACPRLPFQPAIFYIVSEDRIRRTLHSKMVFLAYTSDSVYGEDCSL